VRPKMPGGAALTGPTIRAAVGFVGRVRHSRHPAASGCAAKKGPVALRLPGLRFVLLLVL